MFVGLPETPHRQAESSTSNSLDELIGTLDLVVNHPLQISGVACRDFDLFDPAEVLQVQSKFFDFQNRQRQFLREDNFVAARF